MMALIIVESGGKPNPEKLSPWPSSDRYWGLMQVDFRNLGTKPGKEGVGDGGASYIAMSTQDRIRNNIEVGVGMYVAKLRACWNTQNPVLGLSAYNAGEGTVRGTKSTGGRSVADPGLNEADHNDWTFEQIVRNLKRNATLVFSEKKAEEVANYYPRVHAVYKNLLGKKADLVQNLSAGAGSVPGTGVKLMFPFASADTKKHKMYFTSAFGWRNIGSGNEYHYGIDIATPSGVPVIAAADGTVKHAGGWSTGGTTVILNHAESLQTQYMHLSGIANGVSPGKSVKAGQVIGYVGSTGRSSGPHLHFQLQKGNSSKNAIDPVSVFGFLKDQRSTSKPIIFNN